MTPTKKSTTAKKRPAAKKPPMKKSGGAGPGSARKTVAKKKPVKKVKKPVVLPEVVKEPKKPANPALRMYRRIALGFIVVTVVLLAVVIIMSTIRATIQITPLVDEVSTEFIADIVKETEMEGEIPGRVIALTLEESRDFSVGEEGSTEVPAKAGGMVTIYNISNRAQPLVATTRLLTPDGVLFRIDDGVTVPAGSTVVVMAHADEEGIDGEVGPTSFTIPGLNSTRQKEVYAESTEPMTGGVEYIKMVTEEDLLAAEAELQGDLLEAAQFTLRDQVGEEHVGEVYLEEVLDSSRDTEAGAEADSFEISLEVQVIGVFYDRDALLTIAEAKLYESLDRGWQVMLVKRDEMSVEIEKYDLEEELVNVRVILEGMRMVAPTNTLLSKENLVGLGPQEVSDYLIQAGIAATVDVEFFPFWIRKIPKLRDHIEIRMLTPDPAE